MPLCPIIQDKIREKAYENFKEINEIEIQCNDLLKDINNVQEKIYKFSELLLTIYNDINIKELEIQFEDPRYSTIQSLSKLAKQIQLIININSCLKKIDESLFDKENLESFKLIIERTDGFDKIINKFFGL